MVIKTNNFINTNKNINIKNSENLVFIVGYAAAGKSYLSNEFAKHGYYILSTDEIIRNNLIKDPNDTLHFPLYIEKGINREDLHVSRVKIVSIIKKLRITISISKLNCIR